MSRIIMYIIVFVIFVIIRIVATESDIPMGSFLSFFILAILLGIGNMFVKGKNDNKVEETNEEIREITESKEQVKN